MKVNSRSGFTLIELLVVIAVIATLIVLLLPELWATLHPQGAIDLRQGGLASVMREGSRKTVQKESIIHTMPYGLDDERETLAWHPPSRVAACQSDVNSPTGGLYRDDTNLPQGFPGPLPRVWMRTPQSLSWNFDDSADLEYLEEPGSHIHQILNPGGVPG